jgi:hypothetical protein
MLDFTSWIVTYYGIWGDVAYLASFFEVGFSQFVKDLSHLGLMWLCCYFLESSWISTGRLFWRSWQFWLYHLHHGIRLHEKMKSYSSEKSWWLSSLKGLGIRWRVSVAVQITYRHHPHAPHHLAPSMTHTNHILNFWSVIVVLRRVFLKVCHDANSPFAWWWKSHAQKGEKNHYLWHWQFSFVTICHWLHGLGGVPTSKSASKIC